MISALGYCEDPLCSQSLNHELVRLFRCSLHCDRLLCLDHLNAHNIYYEEEKKQNAVVLNELKNNLTLYQTIFEQQIQEYRELVHQATTLLLHKSSSIIPIEQIRPVLEKLQRAIAVYHQEKIIIKNESLLDTTEFDIDSNILKDISSIKKEKNSPIKNDDEPSRTVVVRLERIDFRLHDEQTNKNSNNDLNIDSISSNHDENLSHILKPRKPTDENRQPDNKKSRSLSPILSKKKKRQRMKKKTEKINPLKRLET